MPQRRHRREQHGDVYFVRVPPLVLGLMRTSGFYDYLGGDHFLDPDTAIEHLFYRVIDPAICIYECPVRAFVQCQNLPKRLYTPSAEYHTEIPTDKVATIEPWALRAALHEDRPPLIIDVREPREFKRGHIPGARLLPLPALLENTTQVPQDRRVILVCRRGRRSSRATYVLHKQGYDNVAALRGGMLAWKAANLLEAID